MWRMVKNVAALHSALTSSLCILCNNSNLQLGTILWFHQKHVAWSLATIARIHWCTLGRCSPAPRPIVWADKTLTFNVQFYECRASADHGAAPPAQLSSLPGRYQYRRDEEGQYSVDILHGWKLNVYSLKWLSIKRGYFQLITFPKLHTEASQHFTVHPRCPCPAQGTALGRCCGNIEKIFSVSSCSWPGHIGVDSAW